MNEDEKTLWLCVPSARLLSFPIFSLPLTPPLFLLTTAFRSPLQPQHKAISTRQTHPISIMKTFAAILAFAATANGQIGGTPSSWMDCTPDSAPTSNREIIFDPAIPKKAERNMIYLTGDLEATVTAGACDVNIEWNRVSALRDSFSVCGNQTVELPLNMGTLYVETLSCPQSPGPINHSGSYEIRADCKMGSGTPLACADIAMKL